MGDERRAAAGCLALQDFEVACQDDDESVPDLNDLDHSMAPGKRSDHAELAQTLDLRCFQMRKHLRAARLDDRWRSSRHSRTSCRRNERDADEMCLTG